MAGSQSEKPCRRCKAPEAPCTLRTEKICRNCFVSFIDTKVSKRFAAIHKETRSSEAPEPRRYVVGLSFGPSSSVLLHILDGYAKYHAAKRSSSDVETLAVHVDTDLSYPEDSLIETPAQRLLAKYRERYPEISMECVHLSKVLGLKTVDWSALPALEGQNDTERLRNLFDKLPSMTSKADVLRLLTRHLLLHITIEKEYKSLFFGYNTASLAALTLSEVANGRGFSVPQQVMDGRFTICTYDQTPEKAGKEVSRRQFPVFYPLREILKNEIITYLDAVPTLRELVHVDTSSTNNIVSHKDLSIDEVMKKYFSDAEGAYSGIIMNVVRTADKLDRVSGSEYCHMCGVTLDEEGDSTWAGELGEEPGEPSTSGHRRRLCYGCIRSIDG